MTGGTWARLAGVTAGVWLMAAPAMLHVGGPSRINDLVVGPIAASLAAVSLSEATRGVRWLVLPAGIWMLAASVLLGAPAGSRLGEAVAGVVLGVSACFGGARWERYGGGWAALRTPASPSGEASPCRPE